MSGQRPQDGDSGAWNFSADPRFVEYYEKESASPETVRRYQAVHDVVLRVRGAGGPLSVADIGCGAGTQCLLWAKRGHRVVGLDVNEPLIEVARQRARAESCDVRFELGSATQLPWDPGSFDVCLVPELLEHVEDWESCLREFARVLRPGGILYVSTTNKLCPLQQEYELPLYSWSPGPLKRHFERLARTTRPELANFATYPAVNWFTFFQLRRELRGLGLRAMDRFDVMDLSSKPALLRLLVRAVRVAPPLRWLAHVTRASTIVVAVR
jgi:2-polyprenyl-6-hydroxyphenyl methylase/3-demethylubiquinone-9 3-methyltransferase